MPKTPPPVPASSSAPETYDPLPVLKKDPPKPDFILKVLSDIDRVSTPMMSSPQRVQAWTFERLRSTRLLDVQNAGEGNRSAAIKLAKAGAEAYVAFLELKTDPFGRYGRSSVRSLEVVVTVYHPNSGKVKFSRTIVVGSNSNLPISRTVMQTCNPGVYGDDILLLEASIEAADTIMDTFSVPRPPVCSAGRGTY